MKTTTVRQLRHDFGSVLGWVEAGEKVRVCKRGHVVALLTPVPPEKPGKGKRPKFAERLDKLFPEGGVKGKSLAKYLEDERYPW